MPHTYNPELPVFIVGGGPSLRGFDGYRLSRRQTLAIHQAHRLIPWTDVLLFKEKRFFEQHRDPQGKHFWRVKRVGNIVTTSAACNVGKPVTYIDPDSLTIRSGRKWQKVDERCAGAQAIALAHRLGAKKIVLLGFDATPGHWTEREIYAPRQLPDAAACVEFKEDMERIARMGLDIVNATPGTALDCFPTAELSTLL